MLLVQGIKDTSPVHVVRRAARPRRVPLPNSLPHPSGVISPPPPRLRSATRRTTDGRRGLRGRPAPGFHQGQRAPRQALPQARPQGYDQDTGGDPPRLIDIQI